ncbi:MAG: outer membrane protein assembly factor BamC [Betaproteobacteria bacterium]|jgi:outer membrane protein assembly factor BamC|nr:MAG: outer membrane protein assembly factor BamC [Betaproteobacteria bacterium]
MKKQFLTGFTAIALIALVGCASDQSKVDYKSAKSLPPLEIPPDLTTPETSSRYVAVEQDGATFSDYTRARSVRGADPMQVLPAQERMRVEGEGNFRWLVVDAEPEALWQPLREFWQEKGFLIARESPASGVMETDWAENRAKAPNSWFRRTFAFMGADRAYSSPERDRFHTRIERGAETGTSEIFITHRGVYQKVVQDVTIARTRWEVRPRDPNLEAEMLYLLMARLGATDVQIQQAKARPAPPPRAELASGPGKLEYLELDDSFDKAWRRVGLALDFIGFTVEDRDRSQGVYFVRYNDPDADSEKTGLEKLAFWRDAEPTDQTFRIQVSEGEDAGSEVHVLDEQGAVLVNSTSSRILALLRDELR